MKVINLEGKENVNVVINMFSYPSILGSLSEKLGVIKVMLYIVL